MRWKVTNRKTGDWRIFFDETDAINFQNEMYELFGRVYTKEEI